jgi:hypothetical protein
MKIRTVKERNSLENGEEVLHKIKEKSPLTRGAEFTMES